MSEMNNTSSGCTICSASGEDRCKQDYCFGNFNPAFQGCGATHKAVRFAPNQCISAGEPLFVGEDGLFHVWVSGEARLPSAIAYSNYHTDEFGFTGCNVTYGNAWICGVFRYPDHLEPMFCAILEAGRWTDLGDQQIKI